MAGHNASMFDWSWTEVSVLAGRALMESCVEFNALKKEEKTTEA